MKRRRGRIEEKKGGRIEEKKRQVEKKGQD